VPEIVISEFLDEASLDRIMPWARAAGREILYQPNLVDDATALADAIKDARALIVRNRTQVRGELLAAAERLEIIGRLGVGLDNIDVEACGARGIKVVPATGANDDSVAEYVISAALTLLRPLTAAMPEMLAGAWPRTTMIGRELQGKTLGLVGFGSIARATARRARVLGMRVGAFDPFVPAEDPAWAETPRFEELAHLLGTVDVVSLHVPLTDDTRHLVDARALAEMHDKAILINAARGGVVHESALAEALRAGKLGGAALDVFEVEPLTSAAARTFEGCPNLILTPHIAGLTDESNARVGGLIADVVISHLETAS
jgi:(S)-sulfolactate dehydrogenase